jgi:hypothetical protein
VVFTKLKADQYFLSEGYNYRLNVNELPNGPNGLPPRPIWFWPSHRNKVLLLITGHSMKYLYETSSYQWYLFLARWTLALTLFSLTMMLKYLRELPLLTFSLAAIVSAASLDIRLPTGTFRGTTAAPGVEKWLGIPFAQPPVGPLRFKAPVAITKRSSALKDATEFGNACPQPPASLGAPISEDCLYLNVC